MKERFFDSLVPLHGSIVQQPLCPHGTTLKEKSEREQAHGRPERVGNILRKLLENLGLDKRVEEYDAVSSWPEAVGEKISDVSRAVGVRGSRIVVEVKGSVWMSEIQMMKNVILERLNAGKGRGVITDVILVQWRERNGEKEE